MRGLVMSRTMFMRSVRATSIVLVAVFILALVFAAYFRPDFLVDLSIFSQLCS